MRANQIGRRDPSGGSMTKGFFTRFQQRTRLTLDASGFLSAVTMPANETTHLENTSDGLLTGMTAPRGHQYSFDYDESGQLTRDNDPAGGFKKLTENTSPPGFTVEVATALGRTTRYALDRLPIGSTQRITTDPAGLQETLVRGTDDTWVSTDPDGSQQSTTLGPDPRFRMQAPLAVDSTFTSPGGLTYHLAQDRTANLTDPQNPLSLISLTDRTTINGRAYTSTFDTATRRITQISPEGRQVVTTVDAQGRPLEVQVGGLQPVTFSYDTRGRLTTVSQGARTVRVTYSDAGFTGTITDPLQRTTTFDYDPDGRVVSQTLPGGRTIGFGYDANGNLTRLTPPGSPRTRPSTPLSTRPRATCLRTSAPAPTSPPTATTWTASRQKKTARTGRR
jgi:YD repeat-containing protein